MWKIRLTLEGGLTHTTNDVRTGNPGWAECRPSGIESIEFDFIGKEDGVETKYKIVLAGMSEYNFFVEAIRSVVGSKTSIKGLWFLGKVPDTNRVVGYVIRDKVQIVNTVSGKEYSGTPTVGWKKGIVGGKVISTMGRTV
jgi:hypothetical protein